MLDTIVLLLIGVVVGWIVPKPAIVDTIVGKVVGLFKKG